MPSVEAKTIPKSTKELETLVITPSLFFQYATCPHWIWHDRFSDPSKKKELPALTQKLLEQGVLHEQEYIKGLSFASVIEIDPFNAFAETLALMRSGADRIYQGEVQYEDEGILYRGRPDLLEKRPGKSIFGDYHYAPVDIKSSADIKKEQWMQLTLYAFILERVQGVFPTDVAIINRDHERVPFVIEETHKEKTKDQIGLILEVMRGKKPSLRLTSDCKDSPWFNECVREAEEAEDIALIYRLDSRSLDALRDCGIRTIHDAARMDVASLPKIPFTSPEVLLTKKIQAQALIDKDLKWLEQPMIPDAPLKIYFDIEGDPLLGVEYLFGFWVVGDYERKHANAKHVRLDPESTDYFVYFLAETPEDEGQMWREFLVWLETLPFGSYRTYHYADYERVKTRALAERYGSSAAFEHFFESYVDLLKVVAKSVIFPLYFYSIKDIAKSKFLNFKWRHEKAGGAQSIFWYEEWLESGNRAILNDVIDYNEDDVRATKYLHEWLDKNGTTVSVLDRRLESTF